MTIVGRSDRLGAARGPIMDRPIVLLMTDDPRIASAMGMLLLDWGYDGRGSSSPWETDHSVPVAAILVDLLAARTEQALNRAIMVRERLGHPVPILIQSNCGPDGARGEAIADALPRVTILDKPVDPARIRAWLSADGRL